MNPSENLEQRIQYGTVSITKKRWILVALTSLFGAFILYFPFMLKMESSVRAILSSSSCPITYEKMDYSLFLLPKVTVSNVNIPAQCMGGKTSLPIEQMNLNFRFFAFDPFGLHFAINIKALETKFDGNLTLGLFEHALNINRNSISMQKLDPYFDSLPKLRGDVELNLATRFTNESVRNLLLNINSKNLAFPPQKISIIDLPLLNIKNLLIKLKTQENGTIKVEDIIIGDDASPIRANFKGTIKPNMRALAYSSVDLSGEFAFGEDFLKDFSLITNLLKPYPQRDGFYQIKLGGTLSNIKPQKP